MILQQQVHIIGIHVKLTRIIPASINHSLEHSPANYHHSLFGLPLILYTLIEMATGLASQLILHPAASSTLKLWSTTVGRDKVTITATAFAFRLITLNERRLTEPCNISLVFSLGSWSAEASLPMLRNGVHWNLPLVRAGNVRMSILWNRKHTYILCEVMRLGKPLEHLQAALRATTSGSPMGEQITAISRQLGYAGYLTYDMLIWVSFWEFSQLYILIDVFDFQANSVKFITLTKETKEKFGKISNRLWLAGIILNLTHALLKVCSFIS